MWAIATTVLLGFVLVLMALVDAPWLGFVAIGLLLAVLILGQLTAVGVRGGLPPLRWTGVG